MNKDSELISIIVPMYNCQNTIERCIDSILSQTYSNIEILIIDDASSDDTLEICDRRYRYEERVIIFPLKTNKGVSAARNVGLDHAKGEYIGFCDSDDFLEPEMLEYLVAALFEENVEISSCNIRGEKRYKNKKLFNDRDELIKELLINGGYVWNKLFCKSIVSDLRFDETLILCEDYYFLVQIYLNYAVKMVKIPVGLYNYSAGGVTLGASNSHFKNNEFAYATALYKVEKIIPDKWKSTIRHKIFMVAIAEMNSDYNIKVLTDENRLILKHVIEKSRFHFLYDKYISPKQRLIFWLRYKIPWLKKLFKGGAN